MANVEIPPETFEQSLKKLLNERIQKYAEDLANKMADEYRSRLVQRMQEMTSAAAIEMFGMVQMSFNARELIITIKTPEPKSK